MKIECEIFHFHPSCQFDKLQITDLQKQYLVDLRAGTSIEQLTERYLANGWLVNFHLLYELISTLTKHHWVLNPAINHYFQNLQIQPATAHKSSAVALSASESNYGEEKLLQLPFFRSLQPDLAKFLLSQGKVSRYQPASAICKIGEDSRDLFVLLSGELGVYTQAATFKQFISILPVGSVFGEAGFLLGEKRTADVVALKKSEVLVIPYQAEVLDRSLNKDRAQSLQQRFWVQHALLHSDFFKNTPPDCLDALTFSGRIVSLDDQQVLVRQNDLSQSAFIVIQGSLLIMQNARKINTLSQGAFLGEISLMVGDGRRTATVIAQRNTRVLEIQRSDFYRLLAKNLFLAQQFQILADLRLKQDVARATKF